MLYSEVSYTLKYFGRYPQALATSYGSSCSSSNSPSRAKVFREYNTECYIGKIIAEKSPPKSSRSQYFPHFFVEIIHTPSLRLVVGRVVTSKILLALYCGPRKIKLTGLRWLEIIENYWLCISFWKSKVYK